MNFDERMESSTPSFASVARGWSWRDKLGIALLLAFRSRPGFWRLLAKCFGERDYIIRVKTPSGAARLIFNPLETTELTVIDELLPGDIYLIKSKASTLLDCGAFRGISAIYLQDQAKATSVTAYEPQADNFSVLSRRLSKYLPEAICINAAVGAESGEMFFEGEGVGGSVGNKGCAVRVVTLAETSDFQRAENLLLKMDIEGAEEQVLPAIVSSLPMNCCVFLETHLSEQQTETLVGPLAEAGFACRKIRSRGDEERGIRFIDWELRREVDQRQKNVPNMAVQAGPTS
jgi:FkbM family methyltransferase